MTKPQRIRLSRAKGFDLQKASLVLNGLPAINVTRPGPWGNPFIVGEDGTRDYCVQLFSYLLAGHIAVTTKATIEAQELFIEHAAAQWKTLRGKNLACWCPPDARCHGDVLLELANRAIKAEAAA